MVRPRQSNPPAPSRSAVPPSFADLYRAHAPRVARWVARLGGPECEIEDAVQEVFLVASRKLGRFPGDGNLTSWLFQITRRIVANQRRRLRWRRLWAGNGEIERLPADARDPDAELERRRTMVLFHQALDRLPDKQRTVFVLYEIEGLSTPAIAELMRRNLSTVKVQLARARERFITAYQRRLRDQYGDGSDLAEIARTVVRVDSPAVPRPGRKVS